MADVQAQVRQQLDQFKAQVHEAAQQVDSLEHLMGTVESNFTDLEHLIQQRMEALGKLFDELDPVLEAFKTEFDHDWQGVLDQCKTLDDELAHDADTLVQDVTQCVHENDDYIRAIEEHDHTVEQHVNDAKKAAEDVIHKVQEVVNGVVDTATGTAGKVVHGVDEAAKGVGHAAQDAFHKLQEVVNTAAEGLKGHGTDLGSLVRAQAEQFGEHVQQQDQQMQAELQAILGELSNGFGGHLQQLVGQAEHFEQTFGTIIGTVTSLTGHGVETVGVMTEAMNATNVGLNVATGTVKDVKDILDEIGL
jgi:ABC-type transporter Mla subunit MlaD